MTFFNWTEDKIRILKEEWPRRSASSIACMIGAPTRNTVIGKAQRLGFKKVPRGERPRQILPSDGRIKVPVQIQTRRKPIAKVFFSEPHKEPIKADGGDTAVSKSLLDPNPQCRWPIDGKGADGMPRCCGQPMIAGSPYCLDHTRISYPNFAQREREALNAAE